MDKGYFLLQQLLAASQSGNRHGRGGAASSGDRAADASDPAMPGLIERIAIRRASGQSFAAIAAELNRQGYSGRYGGRWYASSVSAFLPRHS